MLTVLATTVGLIVGVFSWSQIVLRWRARGVADLRVASDFMRKVSSDVVTHGEVEAPEFKTEEVRANSTRLGDVRRQLRDRKLRRGVDDVIDCWKLAYATAPPPWVGLAWIGGDGPPTRVTTDSPKRREQVARQREAAWEGEAAVLRMLDRCDTLERWVVRG